MRRKNYLAAMFEGISETIAGAEKSFLDLLSALVPWAVPIIPAYLTFQHTMGEMAFPEWVAWTAAFVTEVLGIASVATSIKFWKHNQTYKDAKNRAPFWLAIGTYLFYLTIVLTVNVVLEVVTGTRSGAVILAIGLFSTLSLPAAVLISIRAQHTEILEEREERREERRQARQGIRHESAGLVAYASETQEVQPKTGGKFQRVHRDKKAQD